MWERRNKNICIACVYVCVGGGSCLFLQKEKKHRKDKPDINEKYYFCRVDGINEGLGMGVWIFQVSFLSSLNFNTHPFFADLKYRIKYGKIFKLTKNRNYKI